MVTMRPDANSAAISAARRGLTRPWLSINPTTSGMLARWHGLRSMLSTPQTNAASSASPPAPPMASENSEKSLSTCKASGSLADELQFLQLREHGVARHEALVAERLLALRVEENLQGDDLHAVPLRQTRRTRPYRESAPPPCLSTRRPRSREWASWLYRGCNCHGRNRPARAGRSRERGPGGCRPPRPVAPPATRRCAECRPSPSDRSRSRQSPQAGLRCMRNSRNWS